MLFRSRSFLGGGPALVLEEEVEEEDLAEEEIRRSCSSGSSSSEEEEEEDIFLEKSPLTFCENQATFQNADQTTAVCCFVREAFGCKRRLDGQYSSHIHSTQRHCSGCCLRGRHCGCSLSN